MNETARRLQREAERIASRYPLPEFYTCFQAPIALAKKLFFAEPLVELVRCAVKDRLHEDLGHGMHHSSRVGIDSAALIFVELEAAGMHDRSAAERLMVLGLIAGLLHDISRSEERHAECGAVRAEELLRGYSLTEDEVCCICAAIRNHEAFVAPSPCKSSWGQLLSDCLYDADKFRWGPDTFTHTLWHMMDHQELTPRRLISRFPWGMNGLNRILDTFRTSTGRQYGPGIVEAGAEIGREIYRYLLFHFPEDSDD